MSVLRVVPFLLLAVAEPALAQGLLTMDALSNAGVSLSADELVCDEKHCEAIGDVLLSSGSSLLSAKALEIDLKDRKIVGARARGDVLLIDGNLMTACDFIELGPDLVQGALSFAEIRVKKPGTTGKAKMWDRFGAGSDQLYVTGQISRTGKNTFEVKDVYFTPCDCGRELRPIFSLKAKKAYVEVGSHATFEWPVLQPFDQPLPFPFALPALYVPISKRKSGLLPPSPSVMGVDGFYIEEALFLALHESVDMTVTAGVNEKRGLREKFQLRYAPAFDIEGTFNFSHMLDGNVALTGNRTADVPEPLRGSSFNQRFGGELIHRQGSYGRFSSKANLQMYSDTLVLFDNAFTLAAQSLQYMPSRVALDYRFDDWRLTAGAAAYQDFSSRGGLFGLAAGRTLQRIPDIQLSLAPTRLPLGFRLGADARFVAAFSFDGRQYVRYEVPRDEAGNPVAGDAAITNTGLRPQGVTADCAALPSVVLEQDVYARVATDCEKPLRFGRMDLVPRLSRPFNIGALDVYPEVFGLLALGADSLDSTVRPRGFAAARLELSTQLGRVFGQTDETRWRHRIRPLVRYLLIPAVFGEMPTYRLDERDAFRVTHQVAAGFDTDVFRKPNGGSGTAVAKLSVYQALNLGFPVQADDPRVAAQTFRVPELSVSLSVYWAPMSMSFRGAYDHYSGRLTEASSGVYYSDSYLRAGVSHAYSSERGYWRTNTGLFELAPGGAVSAFPTGTYHSLSGYFTLTPWRGLSIGSTVSFIIQDMSTVQPLAPQTLTARIAYTGACDCFGVELSALFLPSGIPGTDLVGLGVSPPIWNFALTLGDYTFRPQ